MPLLLPPFRIAKVRSVCPQRAHIPLTIPSSLTSALRDILCKEPADVLRVGGVANSGDLAAHVVGVCNEGGPLETHANI